MGAVERGSGSRLFTLHVLWFVVHRVENPILFVNSFSSINEIPEFLVVRFLPQKEGEAETRVQFGEVDLFGSRLVVTHVIELNCVNVLVNGVHRVVRVKEDQKFVLDTH